jgi:hypothetical protein
MRTHSIVFLMCTALIAPATHAIDDFNIQMSKILHEDTSLNHDIYTAGQSAGLWDSQCPLLQKPSVGLRFHATHQEREWFTGISPQRSETELYRPVVDLHFQTIGGVNVGVAYSHGFLTETRFVAPFFEFETEGDSDSAGAYLAKQWDCGFKVGATVSYSTGELRDARSNNQFFDFNTIGASGAVGFARSFGDKTTWKNVFVDTSANFLHQTREDSWHFLWMAKVGHNCCERFSVYGVFNFFYEIDYRDFRFSLPDGFRGYHPYRDDQWGEAGGGFQAELCHGLTFTAEATTPILDKGITAENAFQVRGGLNWNF